VWRDPRQVTRTPGGRRQYCKGWRALENLLKPVQHVRLWRQSPIRARCRWRHVKPGNRVPRRGISTTPSTVRARARHARSEIIIVQKRVIVKINLAPWRGPGSFALCPRSGLYFRLLSIRSVPCAPTFGNHRRQKVPATGAVAALPRTADTTSSSAEVAGDING